MLDVFPLLRYSEHGFKNGNDWDSKADPSVSIDSRRINSARKGELVGSEEGEGCCEGKGGDADILFGIE